MTLQKRKQEQKQSTNKSTSTSTNVNVFLAGVIKLYYKNIRITKGRTLLGVIQGLLETCYVTNALRRNTDN
jgi:hypothetical protein